MCRLHVEPHGFYRFRESWGLKIQFDRILLSQSGQFFHRFGWQEAYCTDLSFDGRSDIITQGQTNTIHNIQHNRAIVIVCVCTPSGVDIDTRPRTSKQTRMDTDYNLFNIKLKFPINLINGVPEKERLRHSIISPPHAATAYQTRYHSITLHSATTQRARNTTYIVRDEVRALALTMTAKLTREISNKISRRVLRYDKFPNS